MTKLSEQIEDLVNVEVDKQTVKYKRALHEAIEILRAIAGEPEMPCDTCGTYFVPGQKIVKTRHAYCSEDCASKAYQEMSKEEKKHAAMPEAVKNSPAAQVARSEAQQNRRALEKLRPKEKYECRECGKLTTKRLYCSESCRKKHEASLVEKLDESKICENCHINKVKNPSDFLCSDKCAEEYWKKVG